SKLKAVSFSALEQSMAHDRAFTRFHVKFGDFISDFLPAYGYNLPGRKRLKSDTQTTMIMAFPPSLTMSSSLSTWTSTEYYLRCNPKFHGHPRYNAVLVKTATEPLFAQLI
ncbi:hypothetical protein B0H17DRAFT_850891, partial [Mycena rosella]